LFFFG